MNPTILALIATASAVVPALVIGMLLGLWDTRRMRREDERE